MLLTQDPVTRITRKIHFRPHEETFVVSHDQDDKEILEGNKASYNTYRKASDRHAEWGDMYARIPAVIWGRLIEQGIAFNEERLRAWLNDSDNQLFRRRPGRI
jgi:hypothetical protein